VVEEPTCPYCGNPLNESIPISLEEPIKIRCPECDSIFVFSLGVGSFRIEDDLGVHISRGRLRSRVSIGAPTDAFERPIDILPRVLFYTCATIIVILIIATLMLTLFISRP
jgi:hypothetical protein